MYSTSSVRLDTQEIVNAILDPDLVESRICSMQPVDVENNVVFVLDLSKLASFKDIYCDDMGSWKHNGVYHAWIDVDESEFVSVLGKERPDSHSASVYSITKKYYVNKSASDLKKTVALLTGWFCHCNSGCYVDKFVYYNVLTKQSYSVLVSAPN